MKIIFILASLGSGGAERVVSLLANRMCEDGHEIQIICLKYNDVYYTLHDEIKVVAATDYVTNRITELWWLRHFIRKEKPDVVISFTEGVYCFTILSLLGTGIPIIASERLDPTAMSPTRKLLKRLLLPYADWLVVQTQSIKEFFPQKIQMKTSIIYNPVREEVFSLPRTSSLTPTPSPKGEGSIKCEEKLNRIISVARLYPQKNQKMMIEAFAKIADEFPDWQLVIFGEGPLRSSLELLVKSLQLDGRVLLPGRTEHVIEELRKSKIFCLSSDYEGMSNSMIEAICVGLPIVTTNVSGVKELVDDNINGFVVECGDVDRMCSALSTLMGNESLMNCFAQKSFERRRLFQMDVVNNKWNSLINQVSKKV